MSQQDNFASGFIFGAIVGGVVGGIVGAVAARRGQSVEEEPSFLPEGQGERINTEADMEKARRRLEDKIAQLNLAIDDVRHQLGNVNGTPSQDQMASMGGEES